MKLAKFIFQARARMLDVRANFGIIGPCLFCLSPNTSDTQQHFMDCVKLCDKEIIFGEVPTYDYLFSKEVKKITRIGMILSEKFTKRKQILNKTARQSK